MLVHTLHPEPSLHCNNFFFLVDIQILNPSFISDSPLLCVKFILRSPIVLFCNQLQLEPLPYNRYDFMYSNLSWRCSGQGTSPSSKRILRSYVNLDGKEISWLECTSLRCQSIQAQINGSTTPAPTISEPQNVLWYYYERFHFNCILIYLWHIMTVIIIGKCLGLHT